MFENTRKCGSPTNTSCSTETAIPNDDMAQIDNEGSHETSATSMLDNDNNEAKFRICQEMYDKEVNYIKNLEMLLTVKAALLDCVAKKQPLLEQERVLFIFGRVHSIVNIHKGIIERLRRLIENWDQIPCNVAEIWIEAADHLRGAYPPYINYCNTAINMLKDACDHHPEVKAFIEGHEKNPSFNRQRVVDVMRTPTQQLPRIELLFKELEKMESREEENARYTEAINAVSNVLSHVCRFLKTSDIKEIKNMPANLVKHSDSVLDRLDVKWKCATNKVKIRRNAIIRMDLFDDSTIVVSKKRSAFEENTWLRRCSLTETMCKTSQKPYKFMRTLKAEQFRSVSFIYSARNDGNKGFALKQTPLCCWEITEGTSSICWFVEVEHGLMEQFATHLQSVRESNSRSLKFGSQMSLTDVPYKCVHVIEEELKELDLNAKHRTCKQMEAEKGRGLKGILQKLGKNNVKGGKMVILVMLKHLRKIILWP